MQWLIVASLVIGCTAYVVWTLMPAAARRAIAGTLLRLPLPTALAAGLRKSSQASSGCACTGCDRAPKKASRGAAQPAAQPITIHRRTRR